MHSKKKGRERKGNDEKEMKLCAIKMNKLCHLKENE